MKSLGLISEGITDYIVIQNILFGYFDTHDLELRPLTPLRDETDQSRTTGEVGWSSVVEYVKSSKFDEAFQFLDYVIIQIDTDVCADYDVPRHEDGNELTPLQLLEMVREKFREWIGEQVFEKRKDSIIFAIAVDSIECWLLPLYYASDTKKRSKTVNCLHALNRALSRKSNFTIDAKNPEYYARVSEEYSNARTIRRLYPHNPSLKAFIEELKIRNFNSDEE